MAQKDRINPDLAVEDRDRPDRQLRAPTNTTKVVEADPASELARSLLEGESAIEKMEAKGQAEFVDSDTLPTKIPDKVRERLEAAGVQFLGPVSGDDQFQYVALPAGWSRVPVADTSYWTDLVDDKGEVVAKVFYKAAHYDRSAHVAGK